MSALARSVSLLAAVLATSSPRPHVQSPPCLPLLPPGTLFGAQFSLDTSNTAAGNRTNGLFARLTSAGARVAQLSLPWADVETVPGQPNLSLIAEVLQSNHAQGLTTLFNLAAIDTNRVSVPADLADPADSTRLRPDLTWTSQEVVDRYAQLVIVVAPLVAYYGGVYFGVGNEVSANMRLHPETVEAFAGFVYTMRTFIKERSSDSMAVGVTFEVGDLAAAAAAVAAPGGAPPPWVAFLTDPSVADVNPLTYYPLMANFSVVTDTASINETFSSALSLLPPGACVVMQELGMPSGFGNASSVDGSTQAAQARFFTHFVGTLLREVDAGGVHPVRAVSAYQLQDMPTAECEGLGPYYNVSGQPGFVEYLCTLGLVDGEGEAKAAFGAYLAEVEAWGGAGAAGAPDGAPSAGRGG